jgi:hypothetical protein
VWSVCLCHCRGRGGRRRDSELTKWRRFRSSAGPESRAQLRRGLLDDHRIGCRVDLQGVRGGSRSRSSLRGCARMVRQVCIKRLLQIAEVALQCLDPLQQRMEKLFVIVRRHFLSNLIHSDTFEGVCLLTTTSQQQQQESIRNGHRESITHWLGSSLIASTRAFRVRDRAADP